MCHEETTHSLTVFASHTQTRLGEPQNPYELGKGRAKLNFLNAKNDSYFHNFINL